jgi:multiple sugar transport system permease protein
MTRFGDALRRHQYVLFIAPSVLAVLALTAYPALYGVFISFTNLHFAYPGWRFVGVDNYRHLFAEDGFAGVLLNTLVFVGAVVFLQVALGLAIALLLDRVAYGRRLMRSIAILPWIIPAVIIGLMFQQLFNGSRLGIMNTLIAEFGFAARGWLSSPAEAMAVMILATVWRGVPLSIILQLGGLQTIDRQLYEAAAIDGAGRWQTLRHVTLPSLKPILTINLILATAGTLNHVDIPLALTGGGPGRATEVLALSIYKQGFEQLDAGYAAAIATLILVLNLALTIAYLRILRSREHGRR